MKKILYGKKIGMTQVFSENGDAVGVTVLEVVPFTVMKVRSSDVDGFNGIDITFGEIKESRLNKAAAGVFKSAGIDAGRYIRTARIDDTSGYEEKKSYGAESFEKGEKVNVRGKSIGKGFAGTVKRHGFGRGPMSHGSKNHRMPGSIGGGTYPGRVLKGTRMGGRMGNKNVTVKNLEIVDVDSEKGLVFIKGAVAGKKNNIVEVFQ